MGSPLDLSTVHFPEQMSVWEAAIYTQSSEMRIRTLIRKELLKATKTEAGIKIAKSDLDVLKANPPSRGGGGGGIRKDGKAFVIHVKPVDLTAVQDFLKARGIELELKNKPSKKQREAAAAKTGVVALAPVQAPVISASDRGSQPTVSIGVPTKK